MSDILINDIRSAVAGHFGIPVGELISSDRKGEACDRRAVAYRICRDLTSASLPQIGRSFGGRDHSTILAGLSRKLPTEKLAAMAKISAVLEEDATHSIAVVRAFPFRSRRGEWATAVPFYRRHTKADQRAYARRMR